MSMDKEVISMTKAELEYTIQKYSRLVKVLKDELSARPEKDEPSFGFTLPEGTIRGYDSREEAMAACLEIYPDVNSDTVEYLIRTFYKHKDEIV